MADEIERDEEHTIPVYKIEFPVEAGYPSVYVESLSGVNDTLQFFFNDESNLSDFDGETVTITVVHVTEKFMSELEPWDE